MELVDKVLIVDDEPDILELLELTLTNMGYQAVKAYNFNQAKDLLFSEKFFLCLTDMRLPDGDGIELVKIIQQKIPELPVAVITAFGNIEGAVNTLKAGAFDYVSKPISLKNLKKLITAAKTLLEQSPDLVTSNYDLVGTSEIIKDLRKNIVKLSRNQAPVFIYGESGVGKELVANLIHKSGPRSSGPFIPVNCGAIPNELMESEFFGHEKGSFTGAVTEHQGLFQAASGGTLFLDEIAELPMHMQVKLLRAIQEKSVRPVGSNNEINIDVRILSATHKDLLTEVQHDNFRQDLYYRINVIELKVPPLRNRVTDIPILVEVLLAKINANNNTSITISTKALELLKKYNFPGNVRELENILERSLAMCENNEILTSDLHLPSNISEHVTTDITPKKQEQGNDLNGYLDDQQREAILKALDETKWNRTAAAKLLGISFRALRYRLKKLNIE